MLHYMRVISDSKQVVCSSYQHRSRAGTRNTQLQRGCAARSIGAPAASALPYEKVALEGHLMRRDGCHGPQWPHGRCVNGTAFSYCQYDARCTAAFTCERRVTGREQHRRGCPMPGVYDDAKSWMMLCICLRFLPLATTYCEMEL